jgi:hypothetical protein
MARRSVDIYKVHYTDRRDSNARLIDTIKPIVGQTVLPETQEQLDSRSYPLSNRNGANAYIIQTEKERVYLNFIAQKTYIPEDTFISVMQPEFEYFLDTPEPEPEPYLLADGMFYRCASDTIKAKEAYTYYIIQNGKAKQIPNYKTLEVMLAERNQTLLSVRVLEKSQCETIPKDSSSGDDKSGQWLKEHEDVTSIEALKKMEDNAKSAGAIVEGAKAEAAKQIDVVKKQAEAAKAQAEAEKAKADAAKAEAEAAKAQAEAEKAEAQQKQAEADAAKAEFEAKGN